MSFAVEMTGITHTFGSFVALEDVDLSVRAGSIHAIVGENGAGKTTLMRILFGALTPTRGQITLRGKPIQLRSAADGIAQGIGMVSQHYSIIPELTCLENLMLGAEPGMWIDLDAATHRAEMLAQRMNFHFRWERPASELSPASAQKLEILKLLWREASVMILDEPTAMLSPTDADQLYSSLQDLAREGATIIVVTHRLQEVMEFAEDVTILRGGRLISGQSVARSTIEDIAEGIVGHSLTETRKGETTTGAARVTVRDLTVLGDRGHEALKRISFQVAAGEVVGIAGVDGNGQRELFQALIGRIAPLRGTIEFDGEDVGHQPPAQRIAAGLRLIPEDRLTEGVIESWSLAENAALGLQRLPPLAKGPWTVPGARAETADRITDRFQTKFTSFDQLMGSLSGGNQQRFVAGRALELNPQIILAFQPTRGLDIHGTSQVYEALRQHARAGGAVLVVSFDLDELLEQCDRIIVLNGGDLREPSLDAAMDRQAIGALMVGAG